MTEKTTFTEEEWKERLTAEQYYVLRGKGTERPYSNQFDEHFETGVYSCAACDQALFESQTKFNSGCGWPAFYAVVWHAQHVTKWSNGRGERTVYFAVLMNIGLQI